MLRYLLILILFPALYLINSSFSWFESNGPYDFFGFWSVVIVLHWATLYFIYKILYKEGFTFGEVGYKLSKSHTIKLIMAFIAIALLLFGIVEWSILQVTIDENKLAEIPGFMPTTTGQRIFFILVVFSAGMCEEIIYRGYAISRGIELGLNKWVAIFIAALSFVFIHGLAGYYYFWMYLTAGLVFGLLFKWRKRLLWNIILHWILDLLVMMVIFGAIER